MRALISGIAAVLVTATLATAPRAQPASSSPDFAKAKQLYLAAEAAMDAGQFEVAARDYTAAYDITRDPVLFYKIGSANEQAGRCDVALGYYGRYLAEAHPAPKYVELTRARIVACGGGADGSNDTASGTGEGPRASSLGPPEKGPEAGPGGQTGTMGTVGPGSGGETTAPGTGPSPETPPPASGAGTGAPEVTGLAPVPAEGGHGQDGAWLMVGGSLAFVTVGAVLAYSASSSEQDLKDLYIGLDGQPPTYDAKTAQRYQNLIDEGHRYQYLAWGSFGIAAGFAVGATIWFLHGRSPESAAHARLVPVVSRHGGGVAWQF